MRIYLTGASGFVGSNLAHVFGHGHGAEVLAPGHVDRVDLARRAAHVFELDPELIDVVEVPGLDAMLHRLRSRVESSWSLACPA